MLRSAVLQQPPELADQACRPGRGEPGGGAADEVAKPGRRVISRAVRLPAATNGRAGVSASTGRTGPTRSGGGPHRTRRRCGAGLSAPPAASSRRTIRSARAGIRACRSAGMSAGPVHARAGDDNACTGPGPAAGPGRRSRRTPASMPCTGRSRLEARGPGHSPGTSSWLPPLAGGASTGSSSRGRLCRPLPRTWRSPSAASSRGVLSDRRHRAAARGGLRAPAPINGYTLRLPQSSSRFCSAAHTHQPASLQDATGMYECPFEIPSTSKRRDCPGTRGEVSGSGHPGAFAIYFPPTRKATSALPFR